MHASYTPIYFCDCICCMKVLMMPEIEEIQSLLQDQDKRFTIVHYLLKESLKRLQRFSLKSLNFQNLL